MSVSSAPASGTFEIDCEACAFLSQPDGDRLPDALRGSGYERMVRDETGRELN